MQPAGIGQTRPQGVFTTISLKGAACGVLIGKYPIEGSTALDGTPENLEEWSTSIAIKLTEGKKNSNTSGTVKHLLAWQHN